jgi:glycosyltransferase involved in cell wall biosynthesis
MYGGTELTVSLLTEELVALGHEVTLFACGGSKTTAKLHAVIDRPLYDILGHFDFSAVQYQDILALKQLFDAAKQGEFDIIHNHMAGFSAAFAPYAPVPMVTTMHSSLAPDFEPLAHAAKDSLYVSISDAQRKESPYLHYAATVYHGIRTADFTFSDKPGDYLLYLATMWQEKGVDRAIKIAKKAGKKLIMAGDIRRESDYEAIKKYIDGTSVVFLGEIDANRKKELFAGAYAYLFPIRWNEAFGLTMVEALASGTPVIAWPNGSVPEVIEDGKTGFLVSSIDDAVKAVAKIPTLSRYDCRKSAVEKFDIKLMARNYVKVYESLVAPSD